jgi:hypothetical protein
MESENMLMHQEDILSTHLTSYGEFQKLVDGFNKDIKHPLSKELFQKPIVPQASSC